MSFLRYLVNLKILRSCPMNRATIMMMKAMVIVRTNDEVITTIMRM